MRVVLDTNILISACLKPAGLEARVLHLALNGALQPCVSPMVLAEYRDVLLRPKFRSFRDRAEILLTEIDRVALLVTPAETLHAALDDDDNRFLECASAANADFLISGNLRHYPENWKPTIILNARAFFDRWSCHDSETVH